MKSMQKNSKKTHSHFLGRKGLLFFGILPVLPWLEEQSFLEGSLLYSGCTLDFLTLLMLVDSLPTLSPFLFRVLTAFASVSYTL